MFDKAKYKNEWIQNRRRQWIKQNGPCKHCGSSESLEVDHINPKEKKIETRSLWSRRLSVRLEELKKCQVLCKKCHIKKTIIDIKDRRKGWLFKHKRTVSIDQALVMHELIKNGMTHREASKVVGISRKAYHIIRKNGFDDDKPRV